MNKNSKPADELAFIREQMKTLKAREQELRQFFLESGDGAVIMGDDYLVEVKALSRRVINKDALPKEILENDKYYKKSTTLYVKAKLIKKAEEDIFDLIDDD